MLSVSHGSWAGARKRQKDGLELSSSEEVLSVQSRLSSRGVEPPERLILDLDVEMEASLAVLPQSGSFKRKNP